jgi:hypothetical protein
MKSPADLEHLAIQWRAETGIVPYGLWCALTDEARERMAVMSQTRAQRMLRGEPDPPRTTTPKMDAVALADLLTRSAP